MAYTDIPTVSVGDLYTASNFNTYLRDNFRAGIPDKFVAQGDIGFGAGVDTIDVLTLGTVGQWLEYDAAQTGGAKWSDQEDLFDWFTFGAFSCASLDDALIGDGTTGTNINNVWTDFSIPDTSSELFLVTMGIKRIDDPTFGYDETDKVQLHPPGTENLMMRVYAQGDTTPPEWNTQCGMMKCSTAGQIKISYPSGAEFNIRLRIWGYA